jgi:hypothetical protein
MLEVASAPGSDDWWLIRLCNQLGANLPRMFRLQSYANGNALIPANMWDGARDSYVGFMQRSRLHVVETVRDARTNKQKVTGFRTAAAGDDAGDLEAWRYWRASNMGVQSRKFFNDTADYGEDFILTRPDETGAPLHQVRNGWDTVTEPDPVRPWLSRFGLTVTYDAVLGVEVATLFGQGWYRVAIRRTMFPTLPTDGTPWLVNADWTWVGDRVVTPYTNRCLITRNSTIDGFGVYEKHLDTVDRINEITLNALTLIVMQSYRQRGVSGNLPEFYPAGHPQAGDKIDYDKMFEAGPAALWMLPADAKIWESAASDVRPIYIARKDEVETLASLTSTPQYVFQGGGENQSAEGAELAREQLVAAVDVMNEIADNAIANAQAIAFEIVGDTVRADVSKLETIFKKTNPSSLVQRAEAAPKFKAGGATQKWIDEHVLEMTPDERRDAEQDRLTEAFTLQIAGGTLVADQSGNNAANG